MVALTLRYFDRVQPSTKWEVVIYVDERADDDQLAALSSIFLGRAGGTVAAQYAPAIGDVHAIRRARITVEHLAPRKRIDLTAYILLEAEETASEPGEVACGIPGLDRPGTELWNDTARSDDPALRWAVRGRGASFATDFDYRPDSCPACISGCALHTRPLYVLDDLFGSIPGSHIVDGHIEATLSCPPRNRCSDPTASAGHDHHTGHRLPSPRLAPSPFRRSLTHD